MKLIITSRDSIRTARQRCIRKFLHYFKKGFDSSEVSLVGFVNANNERHALQIINRKRKEVLDKWPKSEDFDVWGNHIDA